MSGVGLLRPAGPDGVHPFGYLTELFATRPSLPIALVIPAAAAGKVFRVLRRKP